MRMKGKADPALRILDFPLTDAGLKVARPWKNRERMV